ncbi:MAG: 5'/3'-nucleotidase SurE [Ignavibacteriales bacterium]|nr:5'/3'-nucleotidase SurE [Ignavibacteriales bacterium]
MKNPKRKKRPTILVSNDDGIDAPGIYALAQELSKIGDVIVVAPDEQRSAVGHAITMNYPLRLKKFYKNKKFFGYAVDGTPADCVKLAVRKVFKKNPDLLISGINHGSNTAINIIYSGTVSAATEGTILGIPSIAVSLTTYEKADFRYAAKLSRQLAAYILKKPIPKDTLLNVNVPPLKEKEIQGIRITRQGKSRWDDTFDVRRDPNNKEYFWLTGKLDVVDSSEETDLISIFQKYVSITPIHFDLTDYKALAEIRTWQLDKLLKPGK